MPFIPLVAGRRRRAPFPDAGTVAGRRVHSLRMRVDRDGLARRDGQETRDRDRGKNGG